MPSPSRSRRAWRWTGVLAALAVGWLAAAASFGASRGGQPRWAAELLPEGARAELLRVQREQALVRAESTASMLRARRSAPTLDGGGGRP